MPTRKPGSYTKDKRGKIVPNMSDPAMAARVTATPEKEQTDADAKE